jgi:hypothetical protein
MFGLLFSVQKIAKIFGLQKKRPNGENSPNLIGCKTKTPNETQTSGSVINRPQSLKSQVRPQARLPDFSWYKLTNKGEMYQMTIKYTK